MSTLILKHRGRGPLWGYAPARILAKATTTVRSGRLPATPGSPIEVVLRSPDSARVLSSVPRAHVSLAKHLLQGVRSGHGSAPQTLERARSRVPTAGADRSRTCITQSTSSRCLQAGRPQGARRATASDHERWLNTIASDRGRSQVIASDRDRKRAQASASDRERKRSRAIATANGRR